MTSLTIMRLILGLLEFVEFLVSPLGMGLSLWIFLYTVLRTDSSLNLWTAAFLALIFVAQWSITEMNDQV